MFHCSIRLSENTERAKYAGSIYFNFNVFLIIYQERLSKQALSVIPNGKRFAGLPRRSWLNHIEDPVLNRLGLSLDKMKEVVKIRGVWRLNLELHAALVTLTE